MPAATVKSPKPAALLETPDTRPPKRLRSLRRVTIAAAHADAAAHAAAAEPSSSSLPPCPDAPEHDADADAAAQPAPHGPPRADGPVSDAAARASAGPDSPAEQSAKQDPPTPEPEANVTHTDDAPETKELPQVVAAPDTEPTAGPTPHSESDPNDGETATARRASLKRKRSSDDQVAEPPSFPPEPASGSDPIVEAPPSEPTPPPSVVQTSAKPSSAEYETLRPVRQPAYLRYKSLLDSTRSAHPRSASASNLSPPSSSSSFSASAAVSTARRPLPAALSVLNANFNALEDVREFCASRNERCVFHKVQRAVENISHHSFDAGQLAQMVHLMPEAFDLRPVRVVHNQARVASFIVDAPLDEGKAAVLEALATGGSTKTEPGTPDAGARKSVSRTPSVVHSGVHAAKPTKAVDDVGTFERIVRAASNMASRRQTFRARLEDWVAKAHEAFLESRGLDSNSLVATSADGGPAKWHPDFDLESVPSPPLAVLPEPEPTSTQKLYRSGALDLPGISPARRSPFVSIADKINQKLHEKRSSGVGVNDTEPMAGSVAKHETPTSPAATDDQIARSSPSAPSTPIKNGPVAVAPQACESPAATPSKPKSRAEMILERIREKQRLKAEMELLSPKPSPEAIRRKAMLDRLVGIAQSLCLMAISSKRTAIPIADAVAQIRVGLPGHASRFDAVEHITLLAQIAPAFCEVLRHEDGPGATLRLLATTTEKVRAAVELEASKCKKDIVLGGKSSS